MKENKSPVWSRINDTHFGSVLKVITGSNITPEIEKIVREGMPSVRGKNLNYLCPFLFLYFSK